MTRSFSLWRTPAFWWRILILVSCGVGLVTADHRVIFFTTQSNIIVFAYFSGALYGMGRRRTSDAPAPRLRGGVTLWITVTGLVAHFLLSGGANPLPGLFVPDPAEALTNQSLFLLHYVTPVLVLVDWVAFGPHRKVRWRDTALWVLYPVGYGVVVLVRAAAAPTIADRFPYPFVDFTSMAPGDLVIGLLRVIAIVVVLAFAIVGLDRVGGALRRRRR
ncbi:Pr6Pr family membrane protein [Microbacterium sp. P03]|uniref:Pr6Pr family membrane protein n=1 Tax=Microbacterium sp. P03 TaxID=3366946 RepID=UPI00374614E2